MNSMYYFFYWDLENDVMFFSRAKEPLEITLTFYFILGVKRIFVVKVILGIMSVNDTSSSVLQMKCSMNATYNQYQ